MRHGEPQAIRNLSAVLPMISCDMVRVRLLTVVLCCFAGLACERNLPFANYQHEVFEVTPITSTNTRVIKLVNPDTQVAQHIRAIAFDAGGNPGEHFTIDAVRVGDKVVPKHDISVPPGASLDLQVQYAPRDLETTRANYGGIETGVPERTTPQPPPEVRPDPAPEEATAARGAAHVAGLLVARGATPEAAPAPLEGNALEGDALHRALLVLIYDYPQEGVLQLELMGTAVPGPNGELTATTAGGEVEEVGAVCTPSGSTACLGGTLSINLPGLMQRAVETELVGAWPITIEDGMARAQMGQFPLSLFLVQGNGPGEPLEGQPISAISIAITGDPKGSPRGTFDGASLTLDGVSFRIRIFFSAITPDTLTAAAAPVDFLVSDLPLETQTPLANGSIMLGVETTLGNNPTGNPIADPLLSGATVIVEIRGTLALPTTAATP